MSATMSVSMTVEQLAVIHRLINNHLCCAAYEEYGFSTVLDRIYNHLWLSHGTVPDTMFHSAARTSGKIEIIDLRV